jgi:hypothetical protein
MLARKSSFVLPDLNKAQQNFINSVFLNTFTLFIAGWGTGKTLAGVYASFKLIWRWLPGFDGGWVAPTYGTLERSLMYEWSKRIPKNRYKFVLSKSAPHIECYGVRYPDGRPVKHPVRIWLLSGDSEISLESTNLGWIGADECQKLELNVWNAMAGRKRAKVGQFGTKQWGLGLAESETWVHDVLEVNPNKTYHWIKGSPRDNQHNLSDDYVPNLEATLSKEMADSRIDGKFTRGEGYVYKSFNRLIHVKDSARYNPRLPLVACMDFNMEPQTAVIGQYDRNKDLIIWLDEIIENGAVDQQAERLKKWCESDTFTDGQKKPKIDHTDIRQFYIVPDANSGKARQHAHGDTNILTLMNAGFKVRAFARNPNVEDTDNEVSLALIDVSNNVHMLFHPRCVKSTEAMGRLKHKGRKNPLNPYSHPTDAIRYGVHHWRPVNLEAARYNGRKPENQLPGYEIQTGDY